VAVVLTSLDDLVARARGLVTPGSRRLLGLAGTPGAGKSTVAAALAAELDGQTRLVPMDGFHLADDALVRLGRRNRKGAPDTFDGEGYVALLRRLRAATETCVWAPEFRREIEEPIAGAIPVPREVPLVITEGNYLLLPDEPWGEVRRLLDEVWYVRPPDALRIERLIARHVAFGKSPEDAREWVLRSDEANARLISAATDRADVIVELG
jgi:pantothenate kinase